MKVCQFWLGFRTLNFLPIRARQPAIMAYSAKLFTALSLLLLVALTSVASRHVVANPRFNIIEGEERQFLPGSPKERLRGPGGRVEVWSEDFKELQVTCSCIFCASVDLEKEDERKKQARSSRSSRRALVDVTSMMSHAL